MSKCCVIAQVSSVLLIVVYHDIRTERVHECNVIFRRAVITVPAPRIVANRIPSNPCLLGLPTRRLWVWRSRNARFLRTLQAGLLTMGNMPIVSTIEKCSSIVKMQSPRHNGHTHPARCSHDRTVHHVAIQPIATTAQAMSVNTRANLRPRNRWLYLDGKIEEGHGVSLFMKGAAHCSQSKTSPARSCTTTFIKWSGKWERSKAATNNRSEIQFVNLQLLTGDPP